MTTPAIRLTIIFAFFLLAISDRSPAAGQTPSTSGKVISLGIISETHQTEIEEHFRDFVNYIALKFSPAQAMEGKVIVVPRVGDLGPLLRQGTVDFYLESPYPTYVINNVYAAAHLLLRRWKSGMADYQSFIFTKRNSGITRLSDLLGKMIVFEDPESTSGYFLPKLFLQRNGFKFSQKNSSDVISSQEIGYIFAHSQNVVDVVLAGGATAGAFSDDDYNRLDEKKKAEIAVLAQTDRLPRHLVSVRNDLPAPVVYRLREILLSMHEDAEGRRILQKTDETTKFDFLPGGEEGMRRRLLETFYAPEKR